MGRREFRVGLFTFLNPFDAIGSSAGVKCDSILNFMTDEELLGCVANVRERSEVTPLLEGGQACAGLRSGLL